MKTRREVLGDEYVDGAVSATTDFDKDFQEFITTSAWGSVWSREGLSRRDRSLITVAQLASLHYWDELALHIQRTIEQARAYPGRTTALRGQLAHVSIGRLLSLLAAEKREGRLLLVRRDDIATAHLRDGQVVCIDGPDEQEGLDGPGRLLWLLDWLQGRFEFMSCEVTDEDSVQLSTPHALMRHAQLHEEPPTSP